MRYRYDTYCGLYCGACAVLIANREGILEESAQEWEMDPEDLKCHGCKSRTMAIYCKTCDIRQCAEDNQVDFCFQCTEYPCTRLVEFRNDECPHHSVVFQNLETIQKKGVQKWLEEQESRWSCPECGKKFAWYDDTCKKCGTKLYNCKNEEKDIQE